MLTGQTGLTKFGPRAARDCKRRVGSVETRGFRLDKTPVARALAGKLQAMIRSGELPQGTRLPSQRDLAVRFSVSRPMVREALLTLETLGLVETLPARGSFIADPDARPTAGWRFEGQFEMSDVFGTRALIETEICRLAAPHFPASVARALEAANAEFASAWESGDLVMHVEADLRFHRLIVDACPNAVLRTLYQSIQDLLVATQRQPIPYTAEARMVDSIGEHAGVAAALSARDPDAASAAMHEHIENTAHQARLSRP